MIRRSIMLWLAAAAIGSSAASAQTATVAEADSVSAAMATYVGSMVDNSLSRQFPGDDVARKMFVDGLIKAFDVQSVDRVYYEGLAQGLQMRDNLAMSQAQGFALTEEVFVKYLAKALAGQPTGFTEESAGVYLETVADRIRRADTDAQQAFLDAQKAREGVIATPSGLLFEVISEGEGDSPTINDTVLVDYTGRLANGKVFDSSEGNPVKFPVGRLIPGFTEGLQLMKPGGTYRLFIPASIGYGDRGAGNDIPGGAALDFTVKLIEIVK